MTQDERWIERYNEVMTFIETNKRNPSKHRIEEHDHLNWLKANRKEMEDQTAEFEKQNETLKIQRFENTFFNMLSQFQEVVNSLSTQYGRGGRDSECYR